MKKPVEHSEAHAALTKIENKNYEPWEVSRLLKVICASGEWGLIRKAVRLLEDDGFNPLNR